MACVLVSAVPFSTDLTVSLAPLDQQSWTLNSAKHSITIHSPRVQRPRVTPAYNP